MPFPNPPNEETKAPRPLVIGVCIFLAAITWIVFGQTLGYEFINYDDYAYVVDNTEVTKGLTPHGIVWALTHSVSYNWHPLTVISHMLDCQLHGLKAGGHHCTNVMLHMLGAILLFLVLREMTGALWRSAFVAALFAVHPLHVESVAWVAERKDVLSGVFFMLTLAAYVRYVRRPSMASYLLVPLMFVFGLMSKPMLVTVPFVLLLLDYWPLGRVQRIEDRDQRAEVGRQISNTKTGRSGVRNFTDLVLEKIPLLLLSAASCIVTFVVQGRSVSSIGSLPLWVRLYEACVSCVAYVYQMFWPARLAVFYPYPKGGLSIWPFALAIALLIAATVGSFRLRKQHPYVLTGWLWYVGMLVPVLGIIQVGIQARADRYTYLPHIGLYLLVTWTIADLSVSWRNRREILTIGAATTIIVLTWCAWVQTSYWKNSELLWSHTLAVTQANATAHRNLGNVLLKRGQLDEAIFHFQASLKIRPDVSGGRYDPDNARAHYSLGSAFDRKGRVSEAIFHYRKAVELRPDYAEGEYSLGMALLREGHINEAIASWQKSLEIAPRSPLTLNSLAWVLSTCSDAQLRNGSRAIQLAEQADQVSGNKNPFFVRTLAAAYAESGRFNDAIDTAQRGLQLAIAQGDSALVRDLRMDIDLYRMNFPHR